MKAPWPKFKTSIMPKTRVSPEAMVKIITAHRDPRRGQRHECRGRADEGRRDERDDEGRQGRQDVDFLPRQGGADVESAH